MDKQTNIHTNAQGFIPVNTRTIGTPEGIYILYLEDYVHTFMKKLLSNTPQNASLKGRKRLGESQDYQQDCQIESTVQQEIALYGRSIEENGRYRIVISGAAVSDGGSDRIQQLNNTYFPSCSYIGNANVSLNKDSRLRLELTLRSTRVILDDFYIYYDQNEEMQNYLVEWNTTRENDTGSVILSPTEQDTRARNSVGDAAQLSRITQAYNREEAKVSFMWNVMNVLCLGFVVCVMAYGIISMNNYSKMQNMQDNIDYCMAFIEENTSFLQHASGTDADQSLPVSVMQQDVQAESGTAKQYAPQEKAPFAETAPQEPHTAAAEPSDSELEPPAQEPFDQEPSDQEASEQEPSEQEPSTAQDPAQPSGETPEATQALAQPPAVADEPQPPAQEEAAETEPPAQPVQDQTPVPQYYVVRRGDTLRTICYDIYGDYSRVDEICRWNNIDDPNNILYGQKLLLP